MRITNAVYQLSDIQRKPVELRSPNGRSRRTETADPSDRMPATGAAAFGPANPEEKLSFSEMLHEHFVTEVRLRDRDADGRLSWREFGGTREEFESLDRAGTGFVNAADLTREALARNRELRDIIAGPWTPIYEAILQVRDPTEENLRQAVRTAAARVASLPPATPVPQGADAVRHLETTTDENEETSRDNQIADATEGFIERHPELRALHGRLQDLAERLLRSRQYHSIDIRG